MKKVLVLLAVAVLLTVGCNGQVVDQEKGLVKELLTNDQIIVGISPDYPPFESIDNNGEIEGFDVDLMNALLEYINKDNGLTLAVTWKSMDFSTIVGALQAQQIDIGVSGFTYDPDRDVYFSTPYIVSQQVVVVSNDSGITSLDGLAGKKIGVQTGTTGEGAAQEISGATLVSLTDAMQLFAQLTTQAIDAVVIDKAVADGFVKNNNCVVLDTPLIDENMSIIIAKANVNLQQAIDAAIGEFVKTDQYQALLKKWEIEQ